MVLMVYVQLVSILRIPIIPWILGKDSSPEGSWALEVVLQEGSPIIKTDRNEKVFGQ